MDDLKPEIKAFGPILGKELTNRIIELAGGGDKIEAYGKGCMSGLNCEIELSSALIHTLHFGNFYRDAVKAKSYLGFTNTRGPADTQIQIPLMDKNDTGRRSHYLTVQFCCNSTGDPGKRNSHQFAGNSEIRRATNL